ncbi:hypothetical protein ACFULT_09765 [Rhodococcus sp. NPDC057297]|uniref:hypothetical protein n=1 Tax=Rhodococcus sp. NPDC057297 TaxID=3346090 RepID=UPI0036443E77
MRTAIGVSTGTEVVCAALIIEEDNGSRTVEYRTVSADSEVNTDVGDLVASAIDVVLALAPPPDGVGAHAGERVRPEVIAVTHRTEDHAASIRSACGRSTHAIVLVPETAAAHAFLDDAGSIARYRTVTVVDVGATGTTVSVIDTASGEVRHAERTSQFGGDLADRLEWDLLERGGSDDGRDEYETALRPHVVKVGHFARRVAASAGFDAEAVVLIGGGARIPSIRAVLGSVLDLPVILPSDPDTVLAQGAALLALHGAPGRFPTVADGRGSGARSFGRYGSALAGALLVGGIVLAYGIQTLTPSNDSGVSPAGSAGTTSEDVEAVNVPAGDDNPIGAPSTSTRGSSAAPSTGFPRPPVVDSTEYTSGSTTRPSTTPSLRPAPDLPVIPWPASPPEQSTTRPAPQSPTSPPGGGVDSPPTDDPGETVTTPPVTTPPVTTPPVASPEPPTSAPGGSTELSPPPSTPGSIPTTDVNGTPTTPGLSPPTTVWSPPPSAGASDVDTVQPTPSNAPTTSSTTPSEPAGGATTPTA